MSNLPVLSEMSTEVAERAADPAEFVVACCERAKAWLAEAMADSSIDQIVEMKSQAEAIRVYTVQKNLGHDAELAAAEIVRRAERGIGLAIRRGQEAGEIARQGQVPSSMHQVAGGYLVKTTTEAAGVRHTSDVQALTGLADGVTAEQFEEAIEEAKDEGNLSRANVVRKVKGEAPARPRSEFNYGRRHVDHYRVFGETVSTLEGLMMGLRLVDVESIPEQERQEWSVQLRDALRPLNKFAKEIT